MIVEYALVIKVLNPEDVKKFKRRRFSRDREGNYYFTKRVKATEYDKFVEKINKIAPVKII